MAVSTYDESELCKLLLEISLLDSAYHRSATSRDNVLMDAAKLHGVDTEKLQKIVAEEFTATRDKKSKAKAKPKSGVNNGNGITYCYPAGTGPVVAVGVDGSTFIVEPTNAGFSPLTEVFPDGATRTSTFPASTVTTNGNTINVQCCVGPPMVNTDGNTYLEYEVRNVVNNVVTSDALYLYHSDNVLLPIQLSTTTQNEALLPGPIIPDGQRGVLATWTISPSNPPVPQYPYQAADVSNGIVGTPFNLPFSPQSVSFQQSPTLVLGASGVAFASGPTTAADGVTQVSEIASFNIASGSTNWTYQAGPGSTLSIMSVNLDSSLAINDSQNGVIQFGATGSPTQITGPMGGVPQYSWGGNWYVQGPQDTSEVSLPFQIDPANIWATPSGNPSKNGDPDALCPCESQPLPSGSSSGVTSTSIQEVRVSSDAALETREPSSQLTPSPPTDCPICALTSPSCMAPIAGSQSTYLLIVGDQGRNNGPGHNWNVGYSFGLAAQQQANNLNAQGHRIIACRATTVQDFNNELTTNGVIDGGVMYFGHAGQITVLGTTYSALFVGQDPATNENLYNGNINMLSGSQLGPNAAVTLNACDTALPAPGSAPIAQALSIQLGRGVYGYAVGMYFSSQNAASDPSRTGAGKLAPSDLPVLYGAPRTSREQASTTCLYIPGMCPTVMYARECCMNTPK